MSSTGHRTTWRDQTPAGATPVLTGILLTEDGARLPGADLDTLTVTLTDQASGAVVNGRQGQNILNTNGGSVSAQGAFRLELSAADTRLVGATTREVRRALIEFTFGGGERRGMHEVLFAVVGY